MKPHRVLITLFLGLAASVAMRDGRTSPYMDAIGAPVLNRVSDPKTQPWSVKAVACQGKTAPHAGGFGSPTPCGESAESGSGPVESGGVHAGAGATAERYGDTAPVERIRRHRAPSALYTIVLDTSARRGVPFYLLAGLAEDESSWREKAAGKHGEEGLFQLKPDTATWCGGDVDRLDAAQNSDCAARYLYAQFERFGTWELAFVAYKAGPETIPERIPASSWEFAQRALLKAEAYR